MAKFIHLCFIICLLLFMQISVAHAGIVSTHEIFQQTHIEQNRQLLYNVLHREDARTMLEQNGVSTESAQQRIDAMTDAEVQVLAKNFENLPAAGSVGTAAAILILILLIIVLALGR